MLAERLPGLTRAIVELAKGRNIKREANFTMDVPMDASVTKCRDHLGVILKAVAVGVELCDAPFKVHVMVRTGMDTPMRLSDETRIAGFLDVELKVRT
jgi:hypothetical protein